MLKICGNMSKHGIARLGRVAKNVKRIFEMSKIDLTYDEAILCLENFYERFHDDILNYHASNIVEMLLNIRRSINDYLKPIFLRCIRYTKKVNDLQMYEYEIPAEIRGQLVKSMFWDLMNNVRSDRNFPILKTTKYLKMRY